MGARSFRRRLLATLAIAIALVSCTALTGVGDLSVETNTGDAAPTPDTFVPISDGSGVVDVDTTTDAPFEPVDATVVDGCSASNCVDPLPVGFTLVALGPKGQPCPATFTAPADLHESPVAGAGACGCGCNVTSPPNCPKFGNGMVTTFGAAGAGTCPNSGGTTSLGCGTDGYLGAFGAGNEHRYAPPGPNGGTCGTSPTNDSSKVSTTDLRVCAASVVPTCDAKVCPPSLAAPFIACIASNGDVACPKTFPTKHLAGTSVNLTCSGGNCGCSVTATCTGKLSFFTATDCTGTAEFVAVVDGNCDPTVSTPPGASYGSHRYDPNGPTNVGCTTTGSTTAATSLANEATICCP
jgi:hypothetical protein